MILFTLKKLLSNRMILVLSIVQAIRKIRTQIIQIISYLII